MIVNEFILTYVFRAIELLLLALGSVIWWQVRTSDRRLERVADEIGAIREQQVRADVLVGVMQREMGDLRVQMDRVSTRLTDMETRVHALGEKLHAGTDHRS
jgi:hypothetical protein